MKTPALLKSTLETAYSSYHSNIERNRDPISFVHRYSDPRDQEVVGLFAALLAYGNVRSILSSLERLVEPLGQEPRKAIFALDSKNPWEGFYHRFTTADDLFILGHWMRQALVTHETLEGFFTQAPPAPRTEMKPLLSSFVQRFTTQKLPAHLQEKLKRRQRNLKYLVSDPERGSACKRLNLYLRWMVRPKDGIDLGIWKQVGPNQLMLPIDTHLLKIIRKLKWTKSKTATWRVVEESTAKLRTICPEDPIRYDFSLCHLSMRGNSL